MHFFFHLLQLKQNVSAEGEEINGLSVSNLIPGGVACVLSELVARPVSQLTRWLSDVA